MSAYNKVGGDFMGANRRLLRGVLMRSFGFDGFVLYDWFAGGDTVGSAKAGQSVAMPSPLYYEPGKLASALVSGRLGVRTIDGLVRRYLRVMFRFGVFDRAAFPRKAAIPVRRHGRFARAVARRGIVRLRNRRGLLPLDSRRVASLAVIGQAAAEYQAGGGSSHVDPFYEVTALEGIRRRAGRRIGVRFDDGSDPRRAAELARTSDAAIVSATVGSTEFSDRRCLALDCPPAPSRQDDLIRAVAAANRRTVVLLQDPGPVLMPWARRVAAIVEAWYPGEEGGNAIAAVLFGDVNPSAKLPVSYPRRQQDPPAREPPEFPGVGGNVFYTEGVLVGYRHYDERRIRPLFPFGHGLSYTSFDYGPLSIRRLPRQRWRVSVSVSNTGRRAGTEVAQLYLGLPDPRRGVVQPPKALKGFARVALPPRRSRRVSFVLGRRAFSWWDARADRWRVARGCYRVLVGSSSRDVRRRGVISRGGARCRRR